MRRRVEIWPALGREVHQVPIRPHRVDVVRHRFGSPEMIDLSVLFREHMHYGLLHIVGIAILALVISLKRRFKPETSGI